MYGAGPREAEYGETSLVRVRIRVLHGYISDAEDFDEIRRDLVSTARTNTIFLRQYLDALEVVLSEPQPVGTLLRLVEGDANWGIDHDQNDAGAAVFLRDVARLLREVLDGVR
ncbi:hypothetical protein [Actinoplanes sp. NPDC049316]|uniref:hypothetical protein n=1 Tax=Actinoplanes sp. NPDC049316 TaxID=3154727 RepID=UPI0034256286